ncbi:MAG: AAA family ATPase [archaeon]
MIVKLKLKNWKSHEDSEFTFSKGVNALFGIMGSGKSSAMDGLSFGLFGTFPLLNQRKLKLDDVIKSKPKQAQSAEVELEFLGAKGEIFTVLRKVNYGKGTTVSELRQNGELIEGPNSQRVTEQVCKLLGVDYDLFSRAVYSEQNQIDHFLSIPKGQRMAQIDKLLRIDKFEAARKTATSVRNMLDESYFAKEKVIKEMLSEDDEKAEIALKSEIDNQKEAELTLKEELKNLKGAADKLSAELKKLEKNQAELNSLNNKIESKRGQVSQLSESIKSLELELAESQKTLDAPAEENKEELELNTKLADLINLHGDSDTVSKKLDNLKKEIADSEKDLKVLAARAEHSEHIVNELHDKDSCPLCETDLKRGKKKELLSAHNERLKSIGLEKLELAKTIEVNIPQIKELGEALDEIKALEKQLESFKAELETQKKLAAERKKNLQTAEKKIKTEKSALEKLESETKALEELANKSGFDDKLFAELRNSYEEAIKKQSEIGAKLEGLQSLAEEKKKRLDEIERKKALKAEHEKDLAWTGETKKGMEKFQTALQRTQESLREEFIEVVNEVMDEIWGTLYPYGDIETVKLAVDAGDYVLRAKTSAGWYDVEGRVSGGERTMASLALRIAFSLALAPNLSWLVLDEPTHNLDAQSIDELAELLKTRMPKLIDQIFLITHEERLEAAVSGHLYKLERDKEIDGATKVFMVSGPDTA